MNQDQVKEFLLKLDGTVEDFSLIFSGKESSKVHGLYHPDQKEIIIHNRNFQSDGALLYTAVHEFAHHIHFTRSEVPVGPRAHTAAFRRILHELLARAEAGALLENPYEKHEDLARLTRDIREKYFRGQGETVRELGKALLSAQELCRKYELRFEDYLERVLQFDRSTARTIMTIPELEAPPELGYENLKLIAGQRSPDKRREVLTSLCSGESRDQARGTDMPESPGEKLSDKERLLKEKQRLEKTIDTLELKLKALEERLAVL